MKPYVANGGGYLTLSFIPTLGTMILGLAAGRWLRAAAPVDSDAATAGRGRDRHRRGPAAALHGHLSRGEAHLDARVDAVQRRPLLPVPGGLLLADRGKGYRKWAFPLVVIGTNSIAAYLMAHLWERFILDSFRIHLGAHAFAFAGTEVEPFVRGVAVLLVYWVLLYWMYRRKLFLKI